MLDLVVEPDAQVVDEFRAALVVGRAEYGGDVKFLLAAVVEAEAVEVVGGVVGADDEEGVGVGDRLGQEFVDQHRPNSGRTEGQEEERHDHEMPGGVGGVALHPQPPHRRPSEVEDAAHRDLRDRLLPRSPAAAVVHDGERIGGVVDDLPGAGHDGHDQIFECHRNPQAAEKLQVPLSDVGVAVFAGVVVVENVVFVVPGLWEEPVEPVDIPPPAAGEDPARVTGRDTRHAVIAAVEDVVGEQPAGELAEAEQEGTERIGDDPGGGIAQDRGQAAVPFNPLQVGKVGRTDIRMGLGLEPVDGSGEAGDIEVAKLPGKRRVEGCVHAAFMQLGRESARPDRSMPSRGTAIRLGNPPSGDHRLACGPLCGAAPPAQPGPAAGMAIRS